MPINTKAKENVINLYLFYSDTCPHCDELETELIEIEKDFPNIQIYRYEVTKSVKNNKLMVEAAEKLDTVSKYVPFTIIGTKSFTGYSGTQTKAAIEYTLKLYSNVPSYKDPVGELLGIDYSKGTLTYDDIKKLYSTKDIDDKKEESIIDVPFIGPVSLKKLSLPVISILIGAIDGFNPCAMWVLLFLLSILIGMKDRKRMWILGGSFLLASALIYLVFMLAWLNLSSFVGVMWWKMLIAAIALIGGVINLRTFFRSKEAGCEVVNEDKRNKIFAKIKKFTSEKSFLLAIIGIITLAISVNFIEISCSAGLPAMFTGILAMHNLSSIEYAFYIFLYILFFLIDDLIVFAIAMKSLKLTGISNKYVKYSHLIGGIIMLLIGILMIVKPEWLMFNF